jgi:hypothetical protein
VDDLSQTRSVFESQFLLLSAFRKFISNALQGLLELWIAEHVFGSAIQAIVGKSSAAFCFFP